MDRTKVQRLARSLIGGDVQLLCSVADYCGGRGTDTFKERLLAALETSRDWVRTERLLRVLKRLSSDEIVWLCDNGENVRRRSRRQ